MPFVTISACSRSAFGITKTGELYASGANEHGQLGLINTETTLSINRFTKINYLTPKVKQIACGWAHTLLLTEDGELFVSGDGKNGELGLGKDLMKSNVFIKVESIEEKVTQVACGIWSSFVILESGKVLFWGRFRALKLGTIYTPTLLENMNNVIKISVQHNHILTYSFDGKVSGYGCNKYDQISLKEYENYHIRDVFVGWNHSVLWLNSNELILFGKNDHNQLAHSDKFCRKNVLKFENEDIVDVSVGSDHTMVLTNKRLLIWGWNEHGILGQNHTTQIYGSPQELNFDINRIKKIICGTASCFIITK